MQRDGKYNKFDEICIYETAATRRQAWNLKTGNVFLLKGLPPGVQISRIGRKEFCMGTHIDNQVLEKIPFGVLGCVERKRFLALMQVYRAGPKQKRLDGRFSRECMSFRKSMGIQLRCR